MAEIVGHEEQIGDEGRRLVASEVIKMKRRFRKVPDLEPRRYRRGSPVGGQRRRMEFLSLGALSPDLERRGIFFHNLDYLQATDLHRRRWRGLGFR